MSTWWLKLHILKYQQLGVRSSPLPAGGGWRRPLRTVHCPDLSLADPLAACFPPEQDERAQPLFQCLLLPLTCLANNQQVNNTQHLFTNKENPHLSAFISLLFFYCCWFLIPVSNKALTQLNKALQSLAQLTLATGRSIAFLYLSALLGREKGPLLSQPRHLHKASMCCEPGPLTGRAEKR